MNNVHVLLRYFGVHIIIITRLKKKLKGSTGLINYHKEKEKEQKVTATNYNKNCFRIQESAFVFSYT